MKSIDATSTDETFLMWRELGAEEFDRTPVAMLGRRILELAANAKAPAAGAEEWGLLAGFLDALTEKQPTELAKMGIWIWAPDTDFGRKVGEPVRVNLGDGVKATITERAEKVMRA